MSPVCWGKATGTCQLAAPGSRLAVAYKRFPVQSVLWLIFCDSFQSSVLSLSSMPTLEGLHPGWPCR